MEPHREFETLLHALVHYSKTIPNHEVFLWVDRQCKETNRMTYKDLDEQSDAVASHLLQLGCKKGDRVMIAYPFGLEFLGGMLGAMKVGLIPCSCYPPNPGQMKSTMKQFRGLVEDAGAKIALSTTAFAVAMKAASLIHKSGVRWIGTDKLKTPKNQQWAKTKKTFSPKADDIAFIQYTSGSTGTPKGVLVGHRALVGNCRAVHAVSGYPGPGATTALWLPQYHDMGLVGGYLTHIYIRVRCVVASPIDFISRPLLWTDMIETYEAGFTSAPNFAYALLVRRLRQSKRKADWSHMSRVFFGAEPTQQEVLEEVVSELKVKPGHIYNLYGLAEAVVILTGGPATIIDDGLVAAGKVETDTVKLRIVDNQENRVVPDGEVGNIWAQSIRLASGYYGKEELTASAFGNRLQQESKPWLDTGDLGKVVDGTLYVTGRAKDVIIVQGKNHYPTDLERSVELAFPDHVRPGRSAAFQIGGASIGMTTEARSSEKAESPEVASQIRSHILNEFGLTAETVLVLAPGANPKTTSGKLRRSEIKKRTLEGGWKGKEVLLRSENGSLHEQSASTSKGRPVDLSSERNSSKGPAEKFLSNSQHARPELQTILSDILDVKPEMEKTWAENGLSSMTSAELLNRCQQDFRVAIPLNYQEIYETPKQLEQFLLLSMGTTFAKLEVTNYTLLSATLSRASLGIFQGVGVAFILMLVVASLLPAYYVGKGLAYSDLTVSVKIGDTQRYATWTWLPIVVPIFVVTFTLVVVACKYLVIGTYKSQDIPFCSRQYVAWWFCDRLFDLWEVLCGQFLLETKVLWIVYRFLGADISASASINAFVREHDLVKIGSRTVVDFPIRTHKFRIVGSQGSPSVSFRPIQIGSDCKVSGYIGPGCRVGSKCRIGSLSALDENVVVPDCSVALGSPAYIGGCNEEEMAAAWILDCLKLIWLPIQTYLYFGLFLTAQFVVNEQLPMTWRYTPLLYWFLVLMLTAVFGIIISIPMKWMLIGRRSANNREDSEWTQFANWACDYHYRLAQLTLIPFTGASRIWVVVLKLHGMHIDFSSTINGYTAFLPSNVDLITVQRSFVSGITMDVSKNGTIEIVDSNLGYGTHIHSGVSVVRSLVPPRATLNDNLYDENQKASNQSCSRELVQGIGNEVAHLVLGVATLCAAIPAYEVFVNTVYSVPTVAAIPCIAATFLTHCFTLQVLTRVVETVTLSSPHHIQRVLFLAYILHTYSCRIWSFWFLMHGTQAVPSWLRFMGAEVQGDVWLFGHQLYDISKLHFLGAQTVVDGCNLHCHQFVVGEGLKLTDTNIHDALVHPGCYAYAGAHIQGEHGPFKVFGQSTSKVELQKVENMESEPATAIEGCC